MKLRRQLALVSLVTLVLPWVLIEYLKVFNTLIQEGQIRALEATASAVATRLGSDASLLPVSRHADADTSLYAHRLSNAPVIDGYADDWENYALTPRFFDAPGNFSVKLWTGLFADRLSLLVEVTDPSREAHHPGGKALASGDHLVIGAAHRHLILHTGTAGEVMALYRSLTGETYRDYRVKAVVRNTATGYQVELQLPASLADDHFALAVINHNGGKQQQLGTLGPLALLAGGPDPGVLPAPSGGLVTASKSLQTTLQAFTRPGLTLRVTDTNLWQLASAEGSQEPANDSHWLTEGLLAHLSRQRQLPEYKPQTDGRYLSPIAQTALAGQPQWQWFRQRHTPVAVLAVPLYQQGSTAVENRLAGTVIVEQHSAPWRQLHGGALVRLLLITGIAALLLLAALIGYASWLSWRIGRLNRATQRARTDPKPEVLLAQWPQSGIDDELSDLSASYRDLLQQLRGYTDYLKSLSGKLSHELRTPLAVVRTSLDNLVASDLSTEAETYTRRAREGAERLSDILAAMTEATRVEASIQQAEKENIQLAALLEEIASAYSETYGRPVRLITDAPDAEHWRTRVAPELIVQMLDKLVDNANDFASPDTPIELTLTYLPDADMPRCRLCVSNTGPLLPAGLALFDSLTSERLERAGDSRIHMGLGLFIVNLIAQYHGGTASAHNREDGTGVVMDILLPLPPPAVFAPRRL